MAYNPDLVKFLYDKATMSGTPLGGTFELTPRCNMNCKMCYIRMTSEEMKNFGRERSLDEWTELAQSAKDAGMLFVLLTGGEPLLYPDFFTLYERLREMGLIVSINTNAVLFDDRIVEYFASNKPNKINITLYGGSDAVYKRLCGVENGYTRATDAIIKLKASGVNVKINSSITPDNAEDIKRIFEFAKQQECPCSLGTYMFPPVRRQKKTTARFDAKTAGVYQAMIDRLRYSDEDFSKKLEAIAAADRGEIPREQPTKFNCRAGRSSFWITWNGKMSGCGMLDAEQLDPFKDGFCKCWEKINRNAHEVTVMLGCMNCPDRELCHVCPAMSKAESGDINGKPQYLCRMTKAWKKEMKKGVV